MLQHIENISESELLQWVKTSVETKSNMLSHGYQGSVYLYEGNGNRLIIKVPTGWGFGRLIRRAMLRKEYDVYSRIANIDGIPCCWGLLKGCCLVLEYIDGVPIRRARIASRGLFFETLLTMIKELHKAGVAHADLKKKDNLLVVKGRKPYIIDFGVAVVRKPRFAPLNHYLYNLAKTFDFNAWVKLKYDGKFETISQTDRQYYNRTIIERVSHRIKDIYRSIKKAFF